MATSSENSDAKYMDRHQKVGKKAVSDGNQVSERDYGAVAAVTYTKPTGGGSLASSVTRNDITWVFDSQYEVGQYVTGDWWVLGPATVVSVTPAPTASNNGSDINPVPQLNTPFDTDIPYTDMSLGVTYPVTLQPGESLVSTESQTSSGSIVDVIGDTVSDGVQHLRSAEILTAVPTPPLSTEFRPPYCGSVKTRYDSASLRWDLLPSLSLTGGTLYANNATGYGSYARYFERPWIVHGRDWIGRQLHPTENMPNYHQEIYNTIADAALILVSNMSQAEKTSLMIGFVQAGIDMYYATELGLADSSCSKWMVMFAGYMLDDSDMVNTSYNYRTEWMTYYWADATTPYSSSYITPGQTWTGATVFYRQDPGAAEHEHRSPSQPSPGGGSEWQEQSGTTYLHGSGGGIKREAYRRINSQTWPGVALAALSMGARVAWGHEAFFDYVDRWMTEDDTANMAFIEEAFSTQLYIPGQGTGSGFVSNMWNLHRGSYA